MTRFLIGGAAAVLTAAALLLSGVFSDGAGAKVPLTVHQRAHELTVRGISAETRVGRTGDPSYYVEAERALRGALRLEPRNVLATTALGSLTLSRHRFSEALPIGRRAVALSPTTARGYGVLGDALLELGRYEEAFATFNRMVSLKPSVGSYARVSYARELLGDVEGAADAMRLARDAAAGAPASLAWTHLQLGKLYWSQGRLDPAEREYRLALAAWPGWADGFDALAHVAAARGDLKRAIRLERRAAATLPEPDHFFNLGDLYTASADRSAAARAYAAAERAFRREAKAGAHVELELALYQVDRDIRLPEALSLARRAQRARPSIDGDGVLAWALVRNGRCEEALPFAERSLRLGTRDAAKLFHRGMVERCLGNTTAAKSWFRRALDVNPHFSLLWAPAARTYAK